jgi:hypothetical protein
MTSANAGPPPVPGRFDGTKSASLVGMGSHWAGRPPILSIPLTSVVAWLPGHFHPDHGLHSGPKPHPWTTSKGRMSGHPGPPSLIATCEDVRGWTAPLPSWRERCMTQARVRRRTELQACARLCRRRLDPSRPLWEAWLLPGRRLVILTDPTAYHRTRSHQARAVTVASPHRSYRWLPWGRTCSDRPLMNSSRAVSGQAPVLSRSSTVRRW